MALDGSCLCGAVSFSVAKAAQSFSACHCEMCRKFSGGVYMSVQLDKSDVTFTGADKLTHFQSSPWAERAFCSVCGSSVYYRVTLDGPYADHYHMAAGLIRDLPDDFHMELFVDTKPTAYKFSGDRTKLTAAQVEEMFGV